MRNLRVRKGAGSNPAAISIAFCLRNAKKRLKNDVRKAVGGWRKLYFLFGAAAAAGGGGAWHASCAYMPIDRAHRVVADLHRPDLGRTSPSLPLLAATRNRFPFCIFTVWKLMWRTLVRRGSTQLVPGGCPHAVYFLCSASPLFSPSLTHRLQRRRTTVPCTPSSRARSNGDKRKGNLVGGGGGDDGGKAAAACRSSFPVEPSLPLPPPPPPARSPR